MQKGIGLHLRSASLLCAALFITACSAIPTPSPIQVTLIPTQAATQAPTDVASPTVAATSTPKPSDTPNPTHTATATATATPSATATAQPTRTDTPTPAATNTITATATANQPKVLMADGVNLRNGPGVNYGAIGFGKGGETYDITGRNQDGSWLQICCIDGNKVWVATQVIDLIGDPSAAPLAQIPPTATPIGGAIAPPTPIPTGFKNYQDAGTQFSFSYPASYTVSRHAVKSVDLDNLKRGMTLFLQSDPLPAGLLNGDGADAYINDLTQGLAKNVKNVKVLNKGVASDPNAFFVEISGNFITGGDPVQMRFLALPLDDTHAIQGYIITFGDALSDADRQDLARILKSVKLSPGA